MPFKKVNIFVNTVTDFHHSSTSFRRLLHMLDCPFSSSIIILQSVQLITKLNMFAKVNLQQSVLILLS